MAESILAWHWLRDDRRLRFPPHELVEPGTIVHYEGPLEPGTSGLHGSVHALDALRYAPGFVVVRTEHSGQIVLGGDKLCSESRAALWLIDARLVVLSWLCDIGERSLLRERAAGREPDAVLDQVVTVLRRHINNDATLTDVRNVTYQASNSANVASAEVHAAAHASYASFTEARDAYAAASNAANTARAIAFAARAASDSTYAAHAARAAAYAARIGPGSTAEEWHRMNEDLERAIYHAHQQETRQSAVA